MLEAATQAFGRCPEQMLAGVGQMEEAPGDKVWPAAPRACVLSGQAGRDSGLGRGCQMRQLGLVLCLRLLQDAATGKQSRCTLHVA